MKQGTLINRIVMLLFFLAILIYFGGAAWRGLRKPYPAYPVHAYEVDETVEATGYLVRQEEVLEGQGDIVRLLPGEGEKVSAGSTVALLYADAASMERSERLESLQTEAEQIAAAIDQTGASALDSNGGAVSDALVALRASVASGDLTALESQSLSFKSAIYRQAHRYGDADALSAALESTRGEIAALQAQTAMSTGRVTVSHSGIFSGQTDGYEGILTPDSLESLTPSALDALDDVERQGTGVGKLITDASWYFVCPMDESDARRLTEGGSVTVRFSRDWSGEVDMTVERIGPPENGRVAVILSSHKFLSSTTLLRRQTVELVFDRRPGLQVPLRALRVEERTWKDDKGDEHTDQTSCVYVLVGIKAERKWVNILAQGEDYYLVEPIAGEKDTDNQEKRYLRAGDQVIVATQEIYDGMIVEP